MTAIPVLKMQTFVSSGKLISNGAVSLLMYAVQTIVGFFLIPVFIGKLGAETYKEFSLSKGLSVRVVST